MESNIDANLDAEFDLSIVSIKNYNLVSSDKKKHIGGFRKWKISI